MRFFFFHCKATLEMGGKGMDLRRRLGIRTTELREWRDGKNVSIIGADEEREYVHLLKSNVEDQIQPRDPHMDSEECSFGRCQNG